MHFSRRPAILVLLVIFLAYGCGQGDESSVAEDQPPVASPRHGPPSARQQGDFLTAYYPSENRRSLAMNVFKPSGKSKHRAMVLIHGGGWVGGDRAEMSDIARILAKAGYTAVSIDYILSPTMYWPAQLGDVQAAVRHIRKHAKELDVDPKWVGALGVSTGGHLSMFLGTTDAPKDGVSSKVQAVASISGIHDLNQPLTAQGEEYRIVQALLGGQDSPGYEARKQASPDTFVSRTSAPTYFLQGAVSSLVPRAQADKAADLLKKAGVESKVVVVERMGNELKLSDPVQKRALDDMIAWFDKH